MTIAACYLSSEGVVFGADSTSTMWVTGPDGHSNGLHHLNYAQKVFEIGEKSTLGITMWGLGRVGQTSHRSLIAGFSDILDSQKNESIKNIVDNFSKYFWQQYSTAHDEQIKKWVLPGFPWVIHRV